ncbi:MAG: hypothetical protein JNM24_19795 [Bdellovibrionaceae bacterium]|nr:hypothetical protein [Pseudobdellovibrionaceae bacterium]
MRCPKCHFEQPKDPFCAKCGIEMASYKPPADTFVGKILKNATAVFFIVVVALFAGTFYFFKTNRAHKDSVAQGYKKSGLLSQRQYVNDDSPEIEVTGGLKGESSGAGAQASEVAPQSADTTAAVADTSKDIKNQTPDEIREHLENQLFRKEAGGKDESAAIAKYDVKIYFAEVSSKGIDMLYQEARVNGQMANSDFAQGVINMPMTRVLSYRDDFNVYTELSKSVEKNKSIDWFQGLKSAGADGDIGITHTVTIKDSPNGRLQLDVKISKRFQVGGQHSGAKTFQNTDYIGGGEFEIESGRTQTFYMAEILSKFPMASQQDYLMAISPFEIYKSQNFLGGKTFSVFFYTIENK